MMICEYSSNTRHMEDTEVKRRKILSLELHIACHIWNSNSLHIIIFSISYHNDHVGNDVLIIFFLIQDTWEDHEVKRRKIWSLELHIVCHVWNSKSLSIILFPISNHIHHDDNDNLIIFCQIQFIWRTLMSKEGRCWVLNFT